MRTIHLDLDKRGYDITVGSGLIKNADSYFNLERKIFIVTDSGVPAEYARTVANCAKEAKIYTIAQGEASKSLAVLEKLLFEMMDFNMTRADAAIAVGGGVVGDLTGFAASCYMRGIDFYNVPTTLLSQVDSSIGGKCAVNLGKTKNIVGAFYQPKAVLIDTDVLRTFNKRHVSAGLAEAVKMSLTCDADLFGIFEEKDISEENIEEIIVRSLLIKKRVVEEDEKETGLRKVLNFGHTLGHGIEAESALSKLYHGECVALGMIPLTSLKVRERLIAVLKKLGLPTEYNGNIEQAIKYASHDKKAAANGIDVVLVSEIGKFEIKRLSFSEFSDLVKSGLV
jgi:3-dehydroquinate synthase